MHWRHWSVHFTRCTPVFSAWLRSTVWWCWVDKKPKFMFTVYACIILYVSIAFVNFNLKASLISWYKLIIYQMSPTEWIFCPLAQMNFAHSWVLMVLDISCSSSTNSSSSPQLCKWCRNIIIRASPCRDLCTFLKCFPTSQSVPCCTPATL